jgi:hypothetical protein
MADAGIENLDLDIVGAWLAPLQREGNQVGFGIMGGVGANLGHGQPQSGVDGNPV